MTEKRFVYIEHKGADYILDTPNWELDFIEMLGDTLEAGEIVDLLNKLNDENEGFKKALMELKEIGDYQEGRIKELNDENEQLEFELEKVVEVCTKYGIHKEELQYVLADYDKMLNENGERAIRYKYCVNSR